MKSNFSLTELSQNSSDRDRTYIVRRERSSRGPCSVWDGFFVFKKKTAMKNRIINVKNVLLEKKDQVIKDEGRYLG